MIRHVKLTILAVILVLLNVSFVLGASVSVTSSGNGVFVIQGNGMDGVAGIQLDISYDKASLATPTVTRGVLVSGAMLSANTSIPGLIKIAIISTRTFSGSGQIATISFASITGSGGITSIIPSMIDSKGSPIGSTAGTSATETAAPGIVSTPGVPFSQPSQQASTSVQQQSTSTTAAPGAASATTPAYPGTVTVPTDLQQHADSQPAPPSTAPAYTGEPAADSIAEQTQPSVKPAADAKPEETPQYVIYKGIIDRFKQYSGKRDLPSMVALFDKNVAQNIRQEPAILLSNGQSKATLTVDIPARISSSPNFAVNGGTLVSFKQDKKVHGRWAVEVLPEAGAIRVSVTIIAGAEESEYPLTVAPPAKTALTLDERGWNRFLKEVGTTTAPLHDLNNDGVRNYVDEYIFVANLLARKSTPAKTSPASKNSKKQKCMNFTPQGGRGSLASYCPE